MKKIIMKLRLCWLLWAAALIFSPLALSQNTTNGLIADLYGADFLSVDKESHYFAPVSNNMDLQIKEVSIDPKPETVGNKIRLYGYRSYRLTATIGASTSSGSFNQDCFTVRAEAIISGYNNPQGGVKVQIGEGRIGVNKWQIYATFDIFPGSAITQFGKGDYLLQITVDADNQIPEIDESAQSNIKYLQIILE